MKRMMFLIATCLIIVGCVGFYYYNDYSIPQLIPDDYDCENHPGFISESKPAIFESNQDYANRKSKEIKKQIEKVCN